MGERLDCAAYDTQDCSYSTVVPQETLQIRIPTSRHDLLNFEFVYIKGGEELSWYFYSHVSETQKST